ncbi:MAG: Hpt domain-containing protein [Myxococcaceae bacterium]|nr:Hpt domain-containing protein [Myxococcaceae bacterium]
MPDKEPVVDLPTLQRFRALQLADEPSLVAELVSEFLRRAPQRLERMRKALAAGDRGVLALEAHTLVGSCGMLGLFRMRVRCRELEALAYEGAPAEAAATLEEVSRCFEEASPVLTEAAQHT